MIIAFSASDKVLIARYNWSRLSDSKFGSIAEILYSLLDNSMSFGRIRCIRTMSIAVFKATLYIHVETADWFLKVE